MDATFEYINQIPLVVLQMIPTIMFVLTILFFFLNGLRRGLRKSVIYLIISLISFTITLVIFLAFVGESFNTNAISIPNMFLGEGQLQELLGVSSQHVTFDKVAIAYLDQNLDASSPLIQALLVSIGGRTAFIICLAEMFFRLALFLVLLVVYWILKIIFTIFYYIFLREGRRRKKQNRQYEEGLRPDPYKRRRLGGGIVGLCRGFIHAVIYLSFIGSLFFIVTGGNYTKDPIQNQTDEVVAPPIGAVTNIYNFFKTYGTTGVGGIFESVKNKNNIPYYLMIADVVSKGHLKDDELELDEYILLREELGSLTAFAGAIIDFIIENNLLSYSNGSLELDFNDILDKLINSPDFEEVLMKAFDDLSNEKLISGIAKHTIDSFMVAYVELLDEPNPILEILFKDDPISLSQDVFTKDNFMALMQTMTRSIKLAYDMGYTIETIKELDFTSLLKTLDSYSEPLSEVIDSFTTLSVFSSEVNSVQMNNKLRAIFTHYLENMESEQLKNVDFSFMEDIYFVDTFDEEGNVLVEGDLKKLLLLIPDIVNSKILGIIDFKDPTAELAKLVDALVEKDEEGKSVITKVLDTDFVYLTVASVVDGLVIDETNDIKLYVPRQAKVTINEKVYVSREELLILVDVLADALKEVSIEDIQKDPMSLLKIEKNTLLSLLDSYILQGTIANILNSDMESIAEFIYIPDHLQFKKADQTIDDTIFDLWIDTKISRNIVKGEVRKTIEGILDLNALDLMTSEDTSQMDYSLLFKVSQETIQKAFTSDVLRFSLDKMISENLNKIEGDVSIAIPDMSKTASTYPTANPNQKAISADEFYFMLNSFKIILKYDENDPDFKFDFNEMPDLDFKVISDNKEEILMSNIIHATLIKTIYDMSEKNSIKIPEEFIVDLEGENPKLITDFKKIKWVEVKEIERMLDALNSLEITDMNNIDIESKVPEIINNKEKVDILLNSFVIEYTMFDTLYTELSNNDMVYIPKNLEFNLPDVNNSSSWLSTRDSNNNSLKDKELYKMLDAVIELEIIPADATSLDIEIDTNEFLQKDTKVIETVCLSEVFHYTISNELFKMFDDTESDTTIFIPDVTIGKNEFDEKFIFVDEITQMFKACKRIIPEGSNLDELDIDINQIIEDEETKKEVLKSKIIHATIVHQIVTMSQSNGSLYETIYIPLAYDDSYNNELKSDFDNSLWVKNNEIEKLLKAIEIVGIFEGIDTTDEESMSNVEVDVEKIKSLNDIYDEETKTTKLAKSCESKVLYYTLSKSITKEESLFVLDDVLVEENYDLDNENYNDKYIHLNELSALINSFKVLDVNDLETIEFDSLLEVGEFNSFDEKVKELLKSYILEATIAKQVTKNAGGESSDLLVIDELKIEFDEDDKFIQSDNIYNWVSTRDKNLELTSEYKEVYKLLIAIEKLGISADSLNSGEMDVSINDLTGEENRHKRDALLDSDIIHATTIKTVMDQATTGDLKDAVRIPILYSEEYNVLESNFYSNIWYTSEEISKLLDGIDAIGILDDYEEGEDVEFDFSTIKTLNDPYADGKTKLEVVIDSRILHYTMTDQIVSSDDILVLDETLEILPIPDDKDQNLTSKYIKSTELRYLIEAFKVLDIQDVDDIDVSALFEGTEEEVEEKINKVCRSLILEATIAKQAHNNLDDESNEDVLLIDKLKLTFNEEVLDNTDGNIYNWVSTRDENLEVESYNEVHRLLVAAYHLGIGDSLSDGNFDFEMKNIVSGEDKDKKQDKILESLVIHPTIVKTIYNKTRNGGELDGEVSIPSIYVEEINNLSSDFENNLWCTSKEVKNMLVAIGVLGIYDNEEVEIDFTIIKKLTDDYDDSESNLDVVCKSKVLHFTISNQIFDTKELVVLNEVKTTETSDELTDTYIIKNELFNLITSINKLEIDDFNDVSASDLFKVIFKEGATDEEVKENIKDLFASLILESTIAFEAYTNLEDLEGDSVLIVNEIDFSNDVTTDENSEKTLDVDSLELTSNFYTWLYQRDVDFVIDDSNTDKQELAKLLFACYKLGIIDSKSSGFDNVDIKLKDIVGKDNHEKQEVVLKSLLIHGSIINTIVVEQSKSLTDVLYIPGEYIEAYNDLVVDDSAVFKDNIWVDTEEVQKLLIGVEAFDLFGNEDEEDDDGTYTFNYATFKTFNDPYDNEDVNGDTKLDKLLASNVLYYTLSWHILSNDSLVALEETRTSRVYDTNLVDVYIKENELSNFVDSVNALDIEDFDDVSAADLFKVIFADGLSDDEVQQNIKEVFASLILESTIAFEAFTNLDDIQGDSVLIVNELDFTSDISNETGERKLKVSELDLSSNFYTWLFIRDLNLEIDDSAVDNQELARLLFACYKLGIIDSESTGFDNVDIKLKDIVGKDNHDKQDALLKSLLLHGSVINTIVNEQENSLKDVLYVPKEFLQAYDDLVNDLNAKFNENTWVENSEIKNLLVGIEAFDLFGDDDDEDETYTFNYATFKTFNDPYDTDDVNGDTKLDKLISSRVLHFTLSKHMLENDSLLILDVVKENNEYEVGNIDTYIYDIELSNFVSSINLLGVDNFDEIKLSSVFGENEDTALRVSKLLQSYIMESTISKVTTENLTSGSGVVVIEKLQMLNSSEEFEMTNNIYNWISEPQNKEDLESREFDNKTDALNYYKELYRLLLAVDVLDIADSLEGDNPNTDGVTSTILNLDNNQIGIVMDSKVMGYTLSSKIWEVDDLKKAKLSLDKDMMISDGMLDASYNFLNDEEVLMLSDEVSSLLKAIKILIPDLDDLNNVSIDTSTFFSLTQADDDEPTKTKLKVICESSMMWLTISFNILDLGSSSGDGSTTTSIIIPKVYNNSNDKIIVEQVFDDYLTVSEMENLINGLNEFFGGSGASFENIPSNIPSNAAMKEILESQILTATFSKLVKDDFEVLNNALNIKTQDYSDNPIVILNKDDIKELFAALNIIFGENADFSSCNFKLQPEEGGSTGEEVTMAERLLEVFALDNTASQYILRAHISSIVFETYVVSKDINSSYNYKAYEPDTTIEDNSNRHVLTKKELYYLIKSFDLLEIDLNTKDALNINKVIGLFEVAGNEDILLSSQIVWYLLSDMLLGGSSPTYYDRITTIDPSITGIDTTKDHTINTIDYTDDRDLGVNVVHKDNIDKAFSVLKRLLYP